MKLTNNMILITGGGSGTDLDLEIARFASDLEIAHVIAFVASANASYMTGASIPVDGGMIAD